VKRPFLLVLTLLPLTCGKSAPPPPLDAPPSFEEPPPPAFVTVQAEDASTNGTIIGPDRRYPSLAGEAIGRRAVTLEGPGKFVEITVPQAANSIVVRYSIPDSADGVGLEATLGLYVNGVAQADLALTSRFAWTYGTYPFHNTPGDVRPHHFYDEVRRLVGSMAAGSTVRLQVDADNTAPSYTIDLVDFESVPAPLPQPAGSLSLVADFGADPTGTADATAATQNAVAAAASQKRLLFVPPGTYRISAQIRVDKVAVHGAGMWHSTFHFTAGTGNRAGFHGHAPSTNVHLSDFAIRGEVVQRFDNDPTNGVGGGLSRSTLKRLWIEHTKCGLWLDGPFDDLEASYLRVRNVRADGVNFHRGVRNSRVTLSHFRNTGDDAMAMWSHADQGATPNRGNAFTGNTVEMPVLANGIAVYGGTDITIADNIVIDQQAEGGGIHVGHRFSPVTPIAGTITIARNTVIRAGSHDDYHSWSFGTGALWFYALDQPMSGTIHVEDNRLIDSNYEAIHFIGGNISNVTFRNNQIVGARTYAVESRASGGSVTFINTQASGLGRGGYYACAAGAGLALVDGGGNTGWSLGPVCVEPYPLP
jgi:hypothetical protein